MSHIKSTMGHIKSTYMVSQQDNFKERQRVALQERAKQAATPVHLQQKKGADSDPIDNRTPKLKRLVQPKNLLPEDMSSKEDDLQENLSATV